jgi:hypothetical protein
MARLTRLLPLLTLTALVAVPSVAPAADEIAPSLAKADANGSILWYDINLLDLEGKGWADTKAPFDRLPSKAESLVRPPVWSLSRQSAGLCVRFRTDAPAIQARWTLTSSHLGMPHMPPTGVSGLDLYARSSADNRWHWLGVGQPTQAPTNSATLVRGLSGGPREFLLYLPLYNGVSSVEVGLPKENRLAKAPFRPRDRQKPIVFYGTSITQGGCASRPGMVHTALVGRWLDRPVLNLGFSGNGRMEPEMGQLLAELDPAVYVIDCVPNMNAQLIEERAEALVRALVKAHPQTPVLLVEDRTISNAWARPAQQQSQVASRAALRRAYEKLMADKAGNVHYLTGDKLLGEDGEDTVDGSHPTDLGFLRQAEAFRTALAPLLSRS